MTPEGEIKSQCVAYLQRLPRSYVRLVQIGMIPAGAGKWRRNPSKGLPDIVAIVRGQVHWIEVKAGKNKLTPEQEEFIHLWTRAGGSAFVVYSLKDLMDRIPPFYCNPTAQQI